MGSSSANSTAQHPPLGAYRIVGDALLKFDDSCQFFTFASPEHAKNEFRVDVAFIGVELLGAYLDDLLDPQCSDEKLCIPRPLLSKKIGRILSVAAGLLIGGSVLELLGANPALLVATLGTALAIIAAGTFAIREKLLRRVRFARVIYSEIARRNGGDDGTFAGINRDSSTLKSIRSGATACRVMLQ